MDFSERKRQLQRELEALEKVEQVLGDPVARKLLEESLPGRLPAPEPPVSVPDPEPDKATRHGSRVLQRVGARRAVILALHTGSCKFEDLNRTLMWQTPVLRAVLRSMIRHGLVYHIETTGVHGLTEAGKEHARYYLEHPQAKVYGKCLANNLPSHGGVQ